MPPLTHDSVVKAIEEAANGLALVVLSDNIMQSGVDSHFFRIILALRNKKDELGLPPSDFADVEAHLIAEEKRASRWANHHSTSIDPGVEGAEGRIPDERVRGV